MPSSKHLLTRFPFLDTNQIYDARKKQTAIWGRSSSKVIGGKKYHLIHNRVELPRSCIDYLSCTAGVQAEFDERQNRYWLLLPLSGHIEIQINGQEFVADTRRAVLHAPWEHYHFRSTEARAIFYGLDASLIHASLQENCRGCIGQSFEGPYRNVLKELLVGFAEVVDDWATGPVGKKDHPAFMRHLEKAVASCVAEAIKDELTGGYDGGVIGSMPITAIRTFMIDNLATDLTVKEIAEAAGVSVRTLQTGFAEHYFTTPMLMLKTMRLDRARNLLKSPKGPASVSEVCKAVSINHAGRFSKEYAERFGEPPAETLAKRRG